MEDENTGQSAKQRNSDTGTKDKTEDNPENDLKMNLIQHLQQWKMKLNQRF